MMYQNSVDNMDYQSDTSHILVLKDHTNHEDDWFIPYREMMKQSNLNKVITLVSTTVGTVLEMNSTSKPSL